MKDTPGSLPAGSLVKGDGGVTEADLKDAFGAYDGIQRASIIKEKFAACPFFAKNQDKKPTRPA